MSKWVAIPIMVVLALAVGAGVFLYMQQTTKLEETESDLAVTQSNLAVTKSNLAATESELETTENTLEETEDDLADTQSELATTQSDLADAESQISSLNSKVSSLQSEVSGVKSDLAAVQSEYSTFESDVTSLWESLLKKLELEQQLMKFMGTIYEEGTSELRQEQITIFKSVAPLVDDINDGELTRLWAETWPSYLQETTEDEQTLWLMFEEFSDFIDRVSTLIEDDLDELHALLAD